MKKNFYFLLSLSLLVFGLQSCKDDEEVEQLSNLSNIESFSIDFDLSDDAVVTYDFTEETVINVSVPFGTNLSGLITTVAISDLATVSPASGSAVDYTDGEAVTFIVTAEDTTITKSYDVIVTTRAEVGSGTKLATYTIADLYGENATTTYTYDENSGFVASYTYEADDWGVITTTNYELVYDDKNQVIERKATSEDFSGSTVYTYNAEGQIIKGEYTEDGELTYTYDYEYNADGILAQTTRTDHMDEDFQSTTTFTVVNGNVTVEVSAYGESVAEYDDQNNPFSGLYPSAFAAINIGISSINANNPIAGTLADDVVTYEYNEDGYPISAAYTYFDGFATVDKTYTYED